METFAQMHKQIHPTRHLDPWEQWVKYLEAVEDSRTVHGMCRLGWDIVGLDYILDCLLTPKKLVHSQA
jgi:hypothetical protein